MTIPMPTTHVEALVTRTGVASGHGRTVLRPRVEGNVVPVFIQRTGGRDLVGSADLEITEEGIVARMSVAPYAAKLLTGRQIHAHAEMVGGYVAQTRDGYTVQGSTLRGLHCSDAAPAWNDLWVREAGS